MTKVINIKTNEPYDVYIGRGSKWGNPYKIGIDGDRLKVLLLYENYLKNNKGLLKDLPELKGKVLGCFCKPKDCHGDILVRYIEGIF